MRFHFSATRHALQARVPVVIPVRRRSACLQWYWKGTCFAEPLHVFTDFVLHSVVMRHSCWQNSHFVLWMLGLNSMLIPSISKCHFIIFNASFWCRLSLWLCFSFANLIMFVTGVFVIWWEICQSLCIYVKMNMNNAAHGFRVLQFYGLLLFWGLFWYHKMLSHVSFIWV